jgi:hypothetical protein
VTCSALEKHLESSQVLGTLLSGILKPLYKPLLTGLDSGIQC